MGDRPQRQREDGKGYDRIKIRRDKKLLHRRWHTKFDELLDYPVLCRFLGCIVMVKYEDGEE